MLRSVEKCVTFLGEFRDAQTVMIISMKADKPDLSKEGEHFEFTRCSC
jgi:hypothetical protein